MKLELEFGDYLCFTRKFKINEIDANSEDFGEQFDRSPETAEDYSCGDMRFTSNDPQVEVMQKYSITEKEYWKIASKLEDGLSFGCCGLCS